MKFAAGMEHLQKKNPLNVFLYFKKQRAMASVDDSLPSGRLLSDCYRQICVQCPSDKQTWCSQTIKSEKSVKINTPWQIPTLLTLMLLCCKYLQHISRLAPDWHVQRGRGGSNVWVRVWTSTQTFTSFCCLSPQCMTTKVKFWLSLRWFN